MTREEVTALLREAIQGDAPLYLDQSSTWDDTYDGNVVFKIGDYRVIIYKDCGEIDYVDSVELDGVVVYDYSETEDFGDPISELDPKEECELEHMVIDARQEASK